MHYLQHNAISIYLQCECATCDAGSALVCCNFRFGRLGVRKKVGSYLKLRVMETFMAGILKCAPHFLRQLLRKSNRLQAVAGHGGKAID